MSDEKKLPKLTIKQKRFIKEYLKDLNAAQACMRAGYDVSPKNANSLGSQLLSNTNLIPHLEKAKQEHEYRIQIETDDIMDEITNIALEGDITSFLEVHGGRSISIKSLDELSPDQKRCIQSIKETQFGLEVRLYDKLKALELLGKWKRMFTDKVSIETEGEINVRFDNQDRKLL